MPIYEYRCRGCSADFEKYVPGAAAKVACPTCASGDITRKLSVFGLRSDGGVVASMPSAAAAVVDAVAAAGAVATDHILLDVIGVDPEGPVRALRVF